MRLVDKATATDFLPVTQSGFRQGRSVRDNCFVLRNLINLAVGLGDNLVITFIDLKQAFNSTSHSLLGGALHAAGASDKSIGMFRAIYSKAKGRGGATGADGNRTSLVLAHDLDFFKCPRICIQKTRSQRTLTWCQRSAARQRLLRRVDCVCVVQVGMNGSCI